MKKEQNIRISKFIANAGICSRREAEKLILEGAVVINGKKILHPIHFVSEKDKIIINGKPIKKNKLKIFIFHKPRNLITTHKDPEGRTTIFDKIPRKYGRLISVGRLDYNTEGLIILTNNGDIKRFLELPSNKIDRVYKVKVSGKINSLDLNKIKKGIKINKIQYGPIKIKISKENDSISWLELKLNEGKNREIRNILEHHDLKVLRLIRISFGPFKLNNLKKGEIIEVNKNKYKKTLNFLE